MERIAFRGIHLGWRVVGVSLSHLLYVRMLLVLCVYKYVGQKQPDSQNHPPNICPLKRVWYGLFRPSSHTSETTRACGAVILSFHGRKACAFAGGGRLVVISPGGALLVSTLHPKRASPTPRSDPLYVFGGAYTLRHLYDRTRRSRLCERRFVCVRVCVRVCHTQVCARTQCTHMGAPGKNISLCAENEDVRRHSRVLFLT